MTQHALPRRGNGEIRQALLDGQEVALVDVREEAVYAEGHPLFAVNIPLSALDGEVGARIPRLSAPVTLYDNGEGLARRAAERLRSLGYSDVALLEGGLDGWRLAGGELFRDVNSPSKAFGELVEQRRYTPSLSAEQLRRQLDRHEDLVIVDVRRFDEYHTMNIPGSISVPGAELVLRIRDLVPSPSTRIIVNCAGRTRGIIGTQSLINAGIPNPVYALRNGTIGWTLAGQALERGQQRRYGELSDATAGSAAEHARRVADRAGVKRASLGCLRQWQSDPRRTVYVFDVRELHEYIAGHLPGARPVPGGQLVQETDHYAGVRGARIVLVDDRQARADMTASWLAQMNWHVWVLDGLSAADFSEQGDWRPPVPAASPAPDGLLPLPSSNRYRRPYEGTGVPPAIMQAYLDWEYGLVAQLDRDGTHGFRVI